MEKGFRTLKVDPEYKGLSQPLGRNEYRQLERSLVSDGCREPILVWNDTIVDGHNRYEICNQKRVPYATREIAFDSRAAAIAWICTSQLDKRALSEEAKKYLIGKQFEAERHIKRNAAAFQPHKAGPKHMGQFKGGGEREYETRRETAVRLGKEHHISGTTIQRYWKYSQALDAIAKSAPEITRQILSGNYKMTIASIHALARMNPNQLRELSQDFGINPPAFIRYGNSRKSLTRRVTSKYEGQAVRPPAIKTMPAFDPDAEVTALTLTIPSWISSVDRIKTTADLRVISLYARSDLEAALTALRNKAQELLDEIGGDV